MGYTSEEIQATWKTQTRLQELENTVGGLTCTLAEAIKKIAANQEEIKRLKEKLKDIRNDKK